MVGNGAARKALARALARIVLSQETILVYAGSVLERADLIDGSRHSPAFNLWFVVLQRAELENAVERLVASVLEDNPGADSLREALREWSRASSSRPTPIDLEPLPTPAPAPGPASSERARWLALLGLVLGFAALFTFQALREPAQSTGEAGQVLAPLATGTAPPAPAVALGAAEPVGEAARAAPGSSVQLKAALRPLPGGEIRVEADAGVGAELQGRAGSTSGAAHKSGP